MHARHGTLVASTVATVTMPTDARTVEVLNRGSTEIYFTIDGSTPTVSGNDTFVVTAGAGVEVDASGISAPVVKLISTGTPPYSVTAIE